RRHHTRRPAGDARPREPHLLHRSACRGVRRAARLLRWRVGHERRRGQGVARASVRGSARTKSRRSQGGPHILARMRRAHTIATLVLAALAAAVAAQAPTTLPIHFTDVEGGQATLFVLPSGESLLIDTGWAGFNGRDADRIAAAAKRHGVSRIDTLLVTHYHADHVGGVPAIASRLPVRRFVDHGP